MFEENVRPIVDKRLEVKPGADFDVKARRIGDKVEVSVKVARIGKATSAGPAAKTAKPGTPADPGKTADAGKPADPGRKLRLQVALVEEMVHYTGENGVRFHPMVVRSLAGSGKDGLGFPLPAGKAAKIVHAFDIAAAVADAKAHLDDMEGGSSKRFGKFSFIERKNGIDPAHLRIVVFVQDEKTREVLQAESLAVRAPAATAVARGH